MATDKLTIDTPEQVHLEFALADIGSRFMAVFADTAIQLIMALVLVIIDETALSGAIYSHMAEYQKWIMAAIIFLNFCLWWGYYAAFETLWNGQTPGKRWAGIRVIKDNGRPIHAFEAISRNLLRIVDFFPGFYAAGVITTDQDVEPRLVAWCRPARVEAKVGQAVAIRDAGVRRHDATRFQGVGRTLQYQRA